MRIMLATESEMILKKYLDPTLHTRANVVKLGNLGDQ